MMLNHISDGWEGEATRHPHTLFTLFWLLPLTDSQLGGGSNIVHKAHFLLYFCIHSSAAFTHFSVTVGLYNEFSINFLILMKTNANKLKGEKIKWQKDRKTPFNVSVRDFGLGYSQKVVNA